MTHVELVRRAARWLEQKHPIVVTEMAGGAEEPDAIGFRMGFSTLVECKTSRGDYYADRKKGARRMGDWKYFLTPPGLLEGLALTPGWGLLEVHGKVVKKVLEAPQVEDKDMRGEQCLLLSCIRRIGRTSPVGISVKFYTYQTKNRATLGVEDDPMVAR